MLAVLGTGVWIGVQHLGYMEFGELRRVAQRTIERQIFINNLAIRRATEELKVTSDYRQLCRILVARLRATISMPLICDCIRNPPNYRPSTDCISSRAGGKLRACAGPSQAAVLPRN